MITNIGFECFSKYTKLFFLYSNKKLEYQHVSCIFIPDVLELLNLVFRFLTTFLYKKGLVTHQTWKPER